MPWRWSRTRVCVRGCYWRLRPHRWYCIAREYDDGTITLTLVGKEIRL